MPRSSRSLLGAAEPLRDPDVRRYWIGETVALFGAQVSVFALPLVALFELDAGPVDLGLLRAAAFVPVLLIVLPAGAWLDRVRRRPVIVASDLIRAFALAAVPLASASGRLDLPFLLVVAAVVGALTVLFEIAHVAYVPSLVPDDRLAAVNARLQASASAAAIGGPGVAGLLVGLVGAATAIGLDAVSLVVAAVFVARIRAVEPSPRPVGSQPPLRRAVRDGLAFVVRNPILRAAAGEAGMFNILWGGAQVAFLVLATTELGFTAATLGFVFTVGAVGSFAGSLGAERLADRLGYGRAVMAVMVLGTAPFIGLGLALPGVVGVVTVAVSLLIGSVGVGGAIVLVTTLRQTVTPAAMLGRASATYRLLTYGAIPIGALAGGLLTESIGARATVLVCTIGIAVAPIWIARSPIPRLRDLAAARPEADPLDAASTDLAVAA